MQFQDGNFGRTIEPDGQNGGPDSAGNEDGAVFCGYEALAVGFVFHGEHGCPDEGKDNLTTMCVSAQYQVHRWSLNGVDRVRVVCQKDAEFIIGNIAKHGRDIEVVHIYVVHGEAQPNFGPTFPEQGQGIKMWKSRLLKSRILITCFPK